jgi:hypothetical protein
MATITTKFGIGDTVYGFNNETGVITRATVYGVVITSIALSYQPEIQYVCREKGKIAEADAYTEDEVKDLGNAWLAERSITMFSSVGI